MHIYVEGPGEGGGGGGGGGVGGGGGREKYIGKIKISVSHPPSRPGN